MFDKKNFENHPLNSYDFVVSRKHYVFINTSNFHAKIVSLLLKLEGIKINFLSRLNYLIYLDSLRIISFEKIKNEKIIIYKTYNKQNYSLRMSKEILLTYINTFIS